MRGVLRGVRVRLPRWVHPGAGTGVQACLASRPVGVRYPVAPPAGTAVNPCTRMKRMWTRTCLPCRRQPVRGRSSARWMQQARLAESGRRAALRTPCPSGHPGSSPGAGTQRVVGKRPSHLLREQGIAGSSPACPTRRPGVRSGVGASLITRRSEVQILPGRPPACGAAAARRSYKPWSGGSSPSRPTNTRHGAEALQAARPVEARQGEVRSLAAPPLQAGARC